MKNYLFGMAVLACGMNLPAVADVVRNPAYDLSRDKLCASPSHGRRITDEKQSAINAWNKNVTRQRVGEDVLWMVEPNHVLQNLLNRHPLKLNLTTARQEGFDEALLEAIAPCHSDLSKCWADAEKAKAQPSPELRIDAANPEALRFRRSLLRLFEAAETGRANGFVVLREDWLEALEAKLNAELASEKGRELVARVSTELTVKLVVGLDAERASDLIAELMHEFADGEVDDEFDRSGKSIIEKRRFSPTSYRPLVDEVLDDFLIREFVGGRPSFAVVCHTGEAGRTPLRFSSSDLPAIALPVALAGSLAGDETPAKRSALALLSAGNTNSIRTSTRSEAFARGLSQIGSSQKTDLLKFPGYKAERQLVLLKSPDDFAKGSGDAEAASVGAVFGGSNEGSALTVDAALGYRFKWSRDLTNAPLLEVAKSSRQSREFTLTPFASISQIPIDAVVLAPTAEDPSATDETSIGLATLSLGLRWDFDGARIRPAGAWADVDETRVSLRPRPTWKGTIVAEAFTDNFNQQNGTRLGLEISPWDLFNVPGYRKPFDFDRADREFFSGSVRQQDPLGWGHWTTGLIGTFNISAAVDQIDYTKAPLDFSTPFGGDRRTVVELGEITEGDRVTADEFFLYGANFNASLTKRNLFGAAADDGWVRLKIDYRVRDGFEGEFGTEDFLALSATVKHPELSDLSFGIEYSEGLDFKSLQDADTLKFTLGAKY